MTDSEVLLLQYQFSVEKCNTTLASVFLLHSICQTLADWQKENEMFMWQMDQICALSLIH